MIKSESNAVLFYIAAVVLLLSGACANPRYINSPSVHNAAFLRQKGDFKLSATGAANVFSLLNKLGEDANDESLDHSYGLDGQAAVALTDHFLITGSGMMRNERDLYTEDDISDVDRHTVVKYKRSMFDVGAGFYGPMGQSKKVYFNGVLGVGFGKMSSMDDASPFDNERHRTFDANTMKYFLHPSFNFFFNDYVRMSVAPRFSILKLNNITTNYLEEEQTILGYTDAKNRTFGLFEPSVLLQTGFRNNDWLKLDFGFNFATKPFTSKLKNDTYPDVDTYNVKSRNFMFSIGFSVYPGGSK